MPQLRKSLCPRVPDAVLRKLADLGQVHRDQHDFYFSGILYYVEEAFKLRKAVRGLKNKRGAALRHAALTLHEVLRSLNSNERKLVDHFLGDEPKFTFHAISGQGLSRIERTAYELAVLFSLLADKPHPGYPYEARVRRRRGKKPGAVKDSIFQSFICALLIVTKRSRGRFTLEKNIPSGTLIEAIELLSSCLPDNFVPETLPASTLQRLKTWCDKLVIGHDDVEYGLDPLWMYSLYPRPQVSTPERLDTGPELE